MKYIDVMLDSEMWWILTREKGILGWLGLRKKKVHCIACGRELTNVKQISVMYQMDYGNYPVCTTNKVDDCTYTGYTKAVEENQRRINANRCLLYYRRCWNCGHCTPNRAKDCHICWGMQYTLHRRAGSYTDQLVKEGTQGYV